VELANWSKIMRRHYFRTISVLLNTHYLY